MDNVVFAKDHDISQFDLAKIQFVIDQDFVIPDLNLVVFVREDGFPDAILGGRLLVDHDGEILAEKIGGQEILAAATGQIERFVVESD